MSGERGLLSIPTLSTVVFTCHFQQIEHTEHPLPTDNPHKLLKAYANKYIRTLPPLLQ